MHKNAAVAAACLVAGLCGGFFASRVLWPVQAASLSQAVREDSSAYKFIDPLLAVSRTDPQVPSAEYAALYKSVNASIAAGEKDGTLSDASVYFINYGKSGSFAINENASYYPASLLKVIIMVAYLKEADTDPSVLDNQLVYTSAVAAAETIPYEAPSTLTVGTAYSTETLIEKMIIDSDNGAMGTLLGNIDSNYVSQVFSDLGIPGPTGDGSTYTISTKDYTLFFRVLYNATYLSRDNSEKALDLLSQATFKDGLVAGMPADSTVAHKFGEHVTGTDTGITSVELHDCGIAYVSGGPYLLCVMTKGPSLDGLESAIAGISKIVYQSVSAKP